MTGKTGGKNGNGGDSENEDAETGNDENDVVQASNASFDLQTTCQSLHIRMIQLSNTY